MLYVYVCLSRSRPCHALCPPWVCSCVVASIPLVAYWGVSTSETHPRDAGLLDAYPFSAPYDVACHACPIWFARCIPFLCPIRCCSMPVYMLSLSPFFSFFACLLACFLVCYMYKHGVRARPPRHEQKGQR